MVCVLRLNGLKGLKKNGRPIKPSAVVIVEWINLKFTDHSTVIAKAQLLVGSKISDFCGCDCIVTLTSTDRIRVDVFTHKAN